MSDTLANDIDRILPQTQCTRCGYAACRPYAEAIASGEAAINRCPPGGRDGIVKLAALIGREPLALDPGCGAEEPLRAAVVEEADCIGCTLCIQACPVDAIVGAPKLMHTVIAELCTGCELCLPPCPVDCISMAAAAPWSDERAAAARERYEAREHRLAREAREKSERLAARAAAARAAPDAHATRAAVQAALERARSAR